MKAKTSITVCLVAFLTLATPVGAQENATIVETENHSVFTGLFRSVWAQLKSLNPKNGGDASAEVIYTAGIRGAESTDTLLLQQWLECHTGLKQPITIELAAMPVGGEAETAVPASLDLQERISDVITFGDDSELRFCVLAPSRRGENLATDAYYGLLAAISNI